MTLGRAAPSYLSRIFTSSLTICLNCVCPWGQVALASDCPGMSVMHALHIAVCCVFAASPWAPDNAIRAVCAVAHRMLCAQSTAVATIAATVAWLEKRAILKGTH